jgi:hypothetical protein
MTVPAGNFFLFFFDEHFATDMLELHLLVALLLLLLEAALAVLG